jgi:hypothetical protein
LKVAILKYIKTRADKEAYLDYEEFCQG